MVPIRTLLTMVPIRKAMARSQGLGEGPSYLCINVLLPLGLSCSFLRYDGIVKDTANLGPSYTDMR